MRIFLIYLYIAFEIMVTKIDDIEIVNKTEKKEENRRKKAAN